jgi:UDP-GlcNAc3NAcA epimerase
LGQKSEDYPMKKIMTVIGARPQFIKAAAVSRVLRQHPEQVQEKIIHTGQHFDENMSEIFFTEMDIPKPDFNLNIHGLHHGAMTGRMLEGIESILMTEKPDFLLIYGDTNSTLAGALAAHKLHIPVAHVEAGLRSFNNLMPEESNRIIADRLSKFLFCPTDQAIANLKKEGFDYFDCELLKVGDVMYDAALFYQSQAENKSQIAKKIAQSPFLLATIHRQENTDDEKRIRSIFSALNDIHSETPIILPLHPRTQKKLKDFQIKTTVHVIDPVGYFDMLYFLKNCQMVLTDSGGLQKEAYFFEKPCLTLRDETEWVELIQVGANKLVGADQKKITQTYHEFKKFSLKQWPKLYGEGQAAQIMLKALIK